MRNRKFFALITLAALLLILSACGSGQQMKQGQKETSKQNDQVAMDNETRKSDDVDSGDTEKATSNNMNNMKEDEGAMPADNDASNNEKTITNKENILNVTARDFKFNKEKYVVKSGEVTINFKSEQGTHGFALYKSESSFDKIVNIVGEGAKTVKLEPGTYYIHCSVVCGSGHGDMDATLVVT